MQLKWVRFPPPPPQMYRNFSELRENPLDSEPTITDNHDLVFNIITLRRVFSSVLPP